MKVFIKRLAFFSLTVVLIIYLLSIEIDKKNYQADYMAAIIDKHKRIDSSTGARIIFVGGSSTSFGVNSQAIQQEFKLQTTNLALVAGLGLDFMLNEVKSVMRSGDIIILSPEYYLDINGSYDLKLYTAKCAPFVKQYFKNDVVSNYTSVRYKQLKKNFSYIIDRFFQKKHRDLDTSSDFTAAFTHRSDFNSFGDMVGHIDKRPPSKLFYRGEMSYHYYEGIELLNRFYEEAIKKGVKVFMVFNAYARSTFQLNKGTIDKYERDFRENLKIPILGKPSDFAYDDSLFFDSTFHLDIEGREMRTLKLIDLLRITNIF
jgi:hypothetical protein